MSVFLLRSVLKQLERSMSEKDAAAAAAARNKNFESLHRNIHSQDQNRFENLLKIATAQQL